MTEQISESCPTKYLEGNIGKNEGMASVNGDIFEKLRTNFEIGKRRNIVMCITITVLFCMVLGFKGRYSDAPVVVATKQTSHADNTTQESVNGSQTCNSVDTEEILSRIDKYCNINFRPRNRWREIIERYRFNSAELVYNSKQNFVWVVIPKIASRNIFNAILTGNALQNEPGTTLENSQYILTDEAAEANRELEKAFTFTLIRNPWTRLYAAYKENIVHDPSFENYRNIKLILHVARDIPYDNMTNIDLKAEGMSITFQEFLLMLTKISTIDYSGHWMPWFNMAEPCQIEYSRVIYIEDIAREFNDLKDKIAEQPDQMILEGPSTIYNNIDIREEYQKIDANLLDKVYNIYKEDFTIGGYNKDTDCIGTPVAANSKHDFIK